VGFYAQVKKYNACHYDSKAEILSQLVDDVSVFKGNVDCIHPV